MKKDEIIKAAEKLLEENPSKDKVYATGDGNLFWNENAARNHAAQIKGEHFEIAAEVAEVADPKVKKSPAKK
jgi:hypothetical protein